MCRRPIHKPQSTGADREKSVEKHGDLEAVAFESGSLANNTSSGGRSFAFMRVHFWVGVTFTRALKQNVSLWSVYPKELRNQEPHCLSQDHFYEFLDHRKNTTCDISPGPTPGPTTQFLLLSRPPEKKTVFHYFCRTVALNCCL